MEPDERKEQLTQAELHQLAEHLRMAELGTKKAEVYARRTQDGDLQEIFDQVARQHRAHRKRMMGALRDLSGRPRAQAEHGPAEEAH